MTLSMVMDVRWPTILKNDIPEVVLDERPGLITSTAAT